MNDQSPISPRDRQARDPFGAFRLPDGTTPVPLGSGTITALLSRGGTALVYEIWNSQLEINRAVKLLDPDHVEESRERFETEVKITAKLHHPNIVEIYAVGTWNELPFIEMERIDGETLDAMISKRGALPIEVCTAIGVFVSRALFYAHTQDYMIYGKEYHGIIHRDLKPGNIMVSKTGTVKLMDFGIAKPVAASARTTEGMVVGTMQYLSPEQLQGGEIDARSDIYAFGTVLYEMLTGNRTFPEQNIAKLVTDKLSNRYRSLNDFDLKIPSKLKTLVHRCLFYEKEKRIQSALALVKNLEAIHRDITDLPPEEVMESFRNRAVRGKTVISKKSRIPALIVRFILLIILAGGLGAGGWKLYLWWRARPADRVSLEQTAGAPTEKPSMPVEKPPVDSAPKEPAPSPQLQTAPLGQTTPQAVSRRPRQVTSAPASGRSTSRNTPTRTQPPVPAAPPPPPPGTIVDRLAEEYGTREVMTMIEGELQGKRYNNVLELFRFLPREAAESNKARLLRLRTLEKLGHTRAYNRYLQEQEVHDAEFYVAKARYFYRQKMFDRAESYIEKSLKTPGAFIDAGDLKQRRLACKARIAAGRLNANPTPAHKKAAMDAWYDVKLLLRTTPDSPLFTEADQEIRRINATPVE